MEVKSVNPSRPDSYEWLAHGSGIDRFLLDIREGQHQELRSGPDNRDSNASSE